MARTPLRDMRRAVMSRAAFTGNSVFSEHRGDRYIVYSYGHHFPMYICEHDTWYENVDRYSVTTSKHKSCTRPYGVELMPMTTAAMRRIARSGIAGLAAMGTD
jgi:hypothetical protein